MKILGKVKKVEFLRGGISVIIDPVSDPIVEDPYFLGRPRGTFEVLGLADAEGKRFKAGEEVSITIEPMEKVEVEPKGAEIDLSEGGDFGYGDDAAGD